MQSLSGKVVYLLDETDIAGAGGDKVENYSFRLLQLQLYYHTIDDIDKIFILSENLIHSFSTEQCGVLITGLCKFQ